jgi:two-component system nitrogen regulation sensor histidine kinase NtrY
MIFKRFNFLVILRLTLIAANVIIIATIFGDKRLFFNQLILFIILVIQIYELIRFVNYTNRELSRFLLAIKHSDFSITFKKSELGSSFRELHESMIGVIDAYQQVKIEKEAQFHFLNMLVSHLHIGIITFENGNITLINPTAESLLGVTGVKNWKLVQQTNPSFTREVDAIGENGRKLIEFTTNKGSKFLSVDVSSLLVLDKRNKLITFHDINSEIEQKEIEAWHKLIRILTHEIMDSVTPISSLTETMQGWLEDRQGKQKDVSQLTSENIGDIRFALQTIQKRSEGLLNFIDNYRKLTRVPKPKPELINLARFLRHVENLMSNELKQKNIRLDVQVSENISIMADNILLEQVMINLITNSIHALEGRRNAEISLSVFLENRDVVIQVRDNGSGISPKEINEIFTPFFSTKKSGSGIGLSLSKQIMSLHGGTIKVQSQQGVGTSMLLHFKV